MKEREPSLEMKRALLKGVLACVSSIHIELMERPEYKELLDASVLDAIERYGSVVGSMAWRWNDEFQKNGNAA